MSFHYWRNSGRERKQRFVTLTNSYHGETVAAMSVGDVALFTDTYKPLLLDTFKVPSPDCYLRPEGVSWEEHSRQMFAHMEQTLAEHHRDIAAVIVEPLIRGAGGMRMYHPIYLKLLREACDRYEVHLIHDEIAVGFGRTGTMFACEQAGITPDFLCLSGPYRRLSADGRGAHHRPAVSGVLRRLLDPARLLHSHTYTGNPLACAAALATLDIFAEDNVIEANKALAARMASATAHRRASTCGRGAPDRHGAGHRDGSGQTQPYGLPWQERRGLKVYQHALERGALLRPLGSVVYFLPPYCITEEQIDFLAAVASEGSISPPATPSVAMPSGLYPGFRDPG